MKKLDDSFQWADVPEAAKLMGVTRPYVRQLILAGRLPARKIGNAWAIASVEIDRFRNAEKKSGRPRSGG